ncbi:MAG: sigma-70 family RNA polymerase sigma factor [Dehalococcoidia bacterium]|nr:sigma-70 family RNA polymerase sigma factor [Dehalococcoidia bacterium]
MTKQISTQEVFAKLYDEFMPKVFRYIHYKVNDKQITEDLTSAIFEKALVSFDRYSSDKAAFSTWIFSIARNTLIDHYRTNKTRQQVSLDEADEMPSREPSPQEEAEKKAEQEYLRRCLSKLPEDDQEIIRLKFAAEFNNRQIAKMLGLSESNIGVRLYRAVKKLREDFYESRNG